jgi:hypothetical protein
LRIDRRGFATSLSVAAGVLAASRWTTVVPLPSAAAQTAALKELVPKGDATGQARRRDPDHHGSRTVQFRLDMQNLLNRQHYGNPNLDPTSTNFGQIRTVNNTVMRFFTFNITTRF